MNIGQDKNSRLHKFLTSTQIKKRGRRIKFDQEIFIDALEKLQKANEAEYYFQFEDRIIEEIVLTILCMPPGRARRELKRLKRVICSYNDIPPHVETFLKSIYNSVEGAVGVALTCL